MELRIIFLDFTSRNRLSGAKVKC